MVKIRFIHMFEVKLGRELIWLSLAVISLLLVNVNWNLMTESCTVLFHEQLFYRADCFESFNQWKEWGNRILISRPCSRVILSSPSPFFLYPSQDFKLISLSGPQNMMFSLVDVYSIFSFLGGGGGVDEQVLGLIGFTPSMFAPTVICFEGVYLIGWGRGSQYQIW